MGFIFASGYFSRRILKREKRENYPHAKISTFTVHVLNVNLCDCINKFANITVTCRETAKGEEEPDV